MRALTKNGSSALHLAAWVGAADIARELLRAGADVDAHMEDGDTPLHQAVFRDSADCVVALLSAGCAVDATKLDGDTPLHLCAINRHVSVAQRASMAQRLVAAGARADIRNATGLTAEETARGHNEPLIAEAIRNALAARSAQPAPQADPAPQTESST